jgi:hypothetical protein
MSQFSYLSEYDTLSRKIRQKLICGLLMLRKILLGASILCALYFSLSAGISLYKWKRLTGRAWPSSSTWRIVELSESAFAIEADFSFEHKNAIYTAVTRFAKPYCFNKPAAEKEMKILQETYNIAHFDPSNPAHASLQRLFPLKKCLHGLLTIGVALYFLFLDRIFLEKRMQKARI